MPPLNGEKIKVELAKSELKSALTSSKPTVDLSAKGLPQYSLGSDTSPSKSTNEIRGSLAATFKLDLIDPARRPKIKAASNNLEKAENVQVVYRRYSSFDYQSRNKLPQNLPYRNERFFLHFLKKGN